MLLEDVAEWIAKSQIGILFDIRNKSNLYDIWLGNPRPKDKRQLLGNLESQDGQVALNMVGLKKNVENAKLLLEVHLSFY